MGIAEDLVKLRDLHEQGDLSDDEYERAKAKVLAAGEGPARAGSDSPAEADAVRRLLDDMSGRGRAGDATDDGIIDELISEGDGSLGRAANRYVSFQIAMAVVGIILFLLFFFLFFLPTWSSMSGTMHDFPMHGIMITVEPPSGRAP